MKIEISVPDGEWCKVYQNDGKLFNVCSQIQEFSDNCGAYCKVFKDDLNGEITTYRQETKSGSGIRLPSIPRTYIEWRKCAECLSKGG